MGVIADFTPIDWGAQKQKQRERQRLEKNPIFKPVDAKGGGGTRGILSGMALDAIGEAIFFPMNYNSRIDMGQTQSQASAGSAGSAIGSIAGSALGGLAASKIARKFKLGNSMTEMLSMGGAIGGSLLGESALRTAVDGAMGADKTMLDAQMQQMQQAHSVGGMLPSPDSGSAYARYW